MPEKRPNAYRNPRRRAYEGPSREARDRVTADLIAQGISVREWAKQHGIHESTVYQVLSGQKKGRRGEAHRAAVLLGLKEGVISGAKADE